PIDIATSAGVIPSRIRWYCVNRSAYWTHTPIMTSNARQATRSHMRRRGNLSFIGSVYQRSKARLASTDSMAYWRGKKPRLCYPIRFIGGYEKHDALVGPWFIGQPPPHVAASTRPPIVGDAALGWAHESHNFLHRHSVSDLEIVDPSWTWWGGLP